MTMLELESGPSLHERAQRARTWLDAHLPDNMRVDLHANTSPSVAQMCAWERSMYEAGLVGLVWPKAYGGHGESLLAHLTVSREIGYTPMLESVNSIGKELAGPIILNVGTEQQKQQYLPAILEMREIWCQGFSEPEAGSDLAGLRTRVTPADGGWRINGQKIWTSGASKAQRCLLLARTGSVEDRHRGLVLFAVPMDAPGIDVREIQSMDGKKSFCEVFFNDVWISEADMLGTPDGGWAAATRVLGIERATNRMHRAWRFENELSHLIAACAQDSATQELLSTYRGALARCAVDVELLKGHVETQVKTLAGGQEIGAQSSFPKMFWSEAHQRFAQLALEMVSQFPVQASPALLGLRQRMEDIYLKGRAETIFAGTTEIQMDIIAKRILKLGS